MQEENLVSKPLLCKIVLVVFDVIAKEDGLFSKILSRNVNIM